MAKRMWTLDIHLSICSKRHSFESTSLSCMSLCVVAFFPGLKLFYLDSKIHKEMVC